MSQCYRDELFFHSGLNILPLKQNFGHTLSAEEAQPITALYMDLVSTPASACLLVPSSSRKEVPPYLVRKKQTLNRSPRGSHGC